MKTNLLLMLGGIVAGLALGGNSARLQAAEPDLLIADFEGETYGDWKTTGDAFGAGPAHGTLPGQMHVDGFEGKGLVNSFLHGDPGTGTLTSPPFKIERPYLRFLIGGGKFPGKTCMNLIVDGKVARTATGPNDQPGGGEHLDLDQWDVREFLGREASLEIVDQATGGWGHINVDQIVQTEKPVPAWLADATRTIKAEKRYLLFPVKHGATMRRLDVWADGRSMHKFDIELADADPDWWAFFDLTPFQGHDVVIHAGRMREGSNALEAIEQSDELKGAADLYHEKLRPQFHFSARRGWNNDPNGLVFLDGQYHLFFQHNPYGWNWGNMHWGHAVSRDLVHWRELPEALYPDEFGPMFSGSAVVDRDNTSGFGRDGKPPLVLIYTAAGDPTVQCIAYSTDDGATYAKYAGNPVLKQITPGNRDPQVMWYAPDKRWVMALFVGKGNKGFIQFFASPNLKDWTYLSENEGFYECPNFFPLPVDGDSAKMKWVLSAASSEYMVGSFDGKTFTPETPKLPGHRGESFYAPQTFSGMPDGRRVQIGWGQMETPGMPFNQMMCFPCELTLHTTPEGPRLYFQPVKELELLHTSTRRLAAQPLAPDKNPLAGIRPALFDLRAEFFPGAVQEITLKVGGDTVRYDASKQELVCKSHRAVLKPVDGRIRLQVLADRTSLEIYGNDGAVFMPISRTLKGDAKSLALSATGDGAKLESLEIYELSSIWPQTVANR